MIFDWSLHVVLFDSFSKFKSISAQIFISPSTFTVFVTVGKR